MSLSADAKVHVPPPGASPEATGPPTDIPRADITTTAEIAEIPGKAEIAEISNGQAEFSKGKAEFSLGGAEVVSPEKAEEDNGVKCVHAHDARHIDIDIDIARCT
jgi:hypothetical protein